MNYGIDARVIGPGASGIGQYARGALTALIGALGDGDRAGAAGGKGGLLAVVRQGAAPEWTARVQALTGGADGADGALGRVKVVEGGGDARWGHLALPGLLQREGVAVWYSPLVVCPVVRAARQVVTLHDVLPETHADLCTPEFLAFWRASVGPSLRAASQVVTVSAWGKAQVVQHLGVAPARVSVVRQTVSAALRPLNEDVAAPVLAGHGLRWRQYVLIVGALDPRKNLARLVRAMGRLGETGLVLALAGQAASAGYDGRTLVAGAARPEQVRLLGYVPEEDLPALYAGARCFAFPSLAEGFGRPCIEAMACGVPVVASAATALPETCGDAALLPDPLNEAELAAALHAACFDEALRARLVAAGTARAASFTPAQMATDLHAAFAAALAGPEEAVWPASR